MTGKKHHILILLIVVYSCLASIVVLSQASQDFGAAGAAASAAVVSQPEQQSQWQSQPQSSSTSSSVTPLGPTKPQAAQNTPNLVANQQQRSKQPISVHKLHNHVDTTKTTDKLHKFDLFIDPVCEQVEELTAGQLNHFYNQLNLFSQNVSMMISII